MAAMTSVANQECGLKCRSVSPDKTTNEKPSLDTARAAHDQIVDLICKWRVRVED